VITHASVSTLAERLQDVNDWPREELIELDASGEFEILDPVSQTFVDATTYREIDPDENDAWGA
jgi:hypothetical protein